MLEYSSNEEEREVEEFEKLAGLEISLDNENDLTGNNTETFLANEQFPSRFAVANAVCDAVCRSTVANPVEKYCSNLENSLSSSGEESEDEELDEFAQQLEFEVNEEHNVEEPVCSDTIGCNGCIEDFSDQLQQKIDKRDLAAPEISTPFGVSKTRSDNAGEPHEDREHMEEANQEDSDGESLPDPEHCAPSTDNPGGSQEGEVGEGDAETDCDERQQVLAALAEAKGARVTRGDEPERKEVAAAGLSLNLQFSNIVTSFFATKEEKVKFDRIETSRKEAKELARAEFEATQLTGTQLAPFSNARRGGLRWCYKKQLKEFLDEMQESGEACIEQSIEEEGVWSRRNPGRGTKRRRFQHYKDFITLQV